MIESDVVEAVIGLGPNLFYNSPMESMIFVCNTNKPKNRKGKILFINAADEVVEEKGKAKLTDKHIKKIFDTYRKYEDINGFSKVVTMEAVLKKNGNMNISFYLKKNNMGVSKSVDIEGLITDWVKKSNCLRENINNLLGEFSKG
jgi:type I restriction enzyme M protein